MDSDLSHVRADHQRRRIAIFMLIAQFYQQRLLAISRENGEESEDMLSNCRLLSVEISSLLTDRLTPRRIKNYVERIIPGLTARQFQEHFRMTPDVFETILKTIAPLLTSINKFRAITKLMDPKKQLLSVIWLLATPDSYRSVAERFDIAKSSLHFSFVNIVRVLNTKSSNIIKWPEETSMQSIASKFQRFAGISGVIGAVDGTYIPIKAPEEYPERYINRKCYYAISLQAICDADLMFTDVFTGYPSSVSDRRIFVNSDIYKNVLNGTINIPEGYFILGDKAYPVLNWCIPPIIERGNISNEEKNFNVAVAKTRQCVERSFALLKGRFRRLKYLDMSSTHLIPSVILACCTLHNLCLLKGRDRRYIEELINEGLPNVDGEDGNDNSHLLNQHSVIEGQNLRNRIIADINSNLNNHQAN